MITKLKIDLSNGFLEVEADESFVREIYGDYKNNLIVLPRVSVPSQSTRNLADSLSSESSVQPAVLNKEKRPKKRLSMHRISSDLNFSAHGESPDLRTFFSQKNPTTAYEKNTIFIYYLSKILNVQEINVDHIYTCYKFVNSKYPSALKQSLVDTSRDKGYIDTSSLQNVGLTPVGEMFVEHDLPRAPQQS